MGQQSFFRGVRDAKLAAWNAENDYGTAYDILGIRNASLTWTIESDELGGDDVIQAQFSNIIGASLTFEMAAVDLEALDIISGGTLVSNASYDDLIIGKEDDAIPYVAFAGRVVGADGASDLHFFLPKAKISGNLNFEAAYQSWLLPGADFAGVYEGETNGVLRFRHFTAITALEIPLRTTTGTS